MKQCFRCGQSKPLDQFYRHPRMGDGHLGKCRLCTRRDVRDNRALRRQQYLEYDRLRSESPERIAAIHASTNRDPLKVWARKATNKALVAGLIERGLCEVCGDEKTDAHH